MKKIIFGFIGIAALSACGEAPQKTTGQDTPVVASTTPITLSDVGGSPEFANAEIAVGKVTAMPEGDKVKVSFTFDVANYDLKNQTTDANGKMCANSGKGQQYTLYTR